MPIAAITAASIQGCSEAQSADLFRTLARQPMIERSMAVTSVPLEVRMGKLFLPASLNGQTREFIFDTGSPTILNRKFANDLGLDIIGQNTGKDANGREVTMDVAIARSLSLGDVVFSQVPVLIFDFDQLDMGPCIFDGGVIGSEILPGSVWHIDTENSRLDIAASHESFPETSFLAAPMQASAYPHAPIVTYSVGDVRDNAMFDTGNAEQLVLYSKVAEAGSVQGGFQSGSVMTGRGSDGVSAGGRGRTRDLLRFTLPDFFLGNRNLGPIRATTRDTAPSLIGAGLLDRYVVTLDYNSGVFLLQNRQRSEGEAHDAGYAISYVDGTATVTRLFDNAPAARAGLRLGDRVEAINGRRMGGPSASSECEALSWLSDVFDQTAAAEIMVVRNGHRQMVKVPALD